MPTEFWVVITLIFIVAIASIRLGWVLAMETFSNRMTKELRTEAAEHFRKEYFDDFVRIFDEKVEIRAREIAEEIINEKKENNDESSSSS